MISRRSTLVGASAALLVPVVSSKAGAQGASVSGCHAYESLQFLPPIVDPSTSTVVGNDPTPAIDVAKAFRLMLKSPSGKDPIDVANYFNKLEVKSEAKYPTGPTTKANLPFREEWPTPGPANPLIVGFFAATQLLPSGDQTAWCAAFVNYCLFQAGKVGTSSAASTSFRKIAKDVQAHTPVSGDIAVFRDAGPKGDDPDGQGHVGFFVAPSDVASGKYPARAKALAQYNQNPTGQIWVLGGNQRGGDPGSTGGVKAAPIPVNSGLILLGFVPVASFRDIPEV